MPATDPSSVTLFTGHTSLTDRPRPLRALGSEFSTGLALLAALVTPWVSACNRNGDRVRVEHKLHSAKQDTSIYSSGEMAGRVIFATGPEGVPAPGASVVVIDTAAGKQVLEELQKEPDATCLKRLDDMQSTLLAAAKASADSCHTPPTATADADGYFVLPQVRPGTYMVIAYERAGHVQAIWEQPAMVDAYQAVAVKLVDPLISCEAEEKPNPEQPPPLPPPNVQPILPTAPPKPQPAPAVPPATTTPSPTPPS
jgi:hypothetical protein